MYKELKLISRDTANRSSDVPLFNSAADFEWDDNGGFVLCESSEGLEQTILKAVLTRVQSNGYGTIVQSLKGLKIKTLLITILNTEVIASLNVTKKAQAAFYTLYPTFDKKQMIGRLTYIKVYRKDKDKITIILNVDSQGKLEEEVNPTTQSIRTEI